MIVIPFLGLLIGFLVSYQLGLVMPSNWTPYLSLATIAGLDTTFGGVRAGIEGKFHLDVFLSGFLFNTLFAAFLAWLGDQIAVDLYLAAVVLLGGRILVNVSLIRRFYLNQITIAREQRR
jgi:small basic protein